MVLSALIIFVLSWAPVRAEENVVSGLDELEGKGHFGTEFNYPKFHSFGEFVSDFFEISKLARQAGKKGYQLDPKFRETICLAVTFANNCRA